MIPFSVRTAGCRFLYFIALFAVWALSASEVGAAGPSNAPPTVAISSPAKGAIFRAPVNIDLVALPYDSDGTVTRVDFLNGTQAIGAATSFPWQFTWQNVQPGTYSITAKATDNGSATGTSSVVTFTVQPPSTELPQVVLTAPINCSSLTPLALIAFKADAYSANGIQRVDFISNGQVVGTSTTAPYKWDWNNVPAGLYQLSARAVDKTGLSRDTPPITVTVAAPNTLPAVSLTAPADGATYTAPADITFTATASDSDGSVDHVEFLANGNVVQSTAVSPYQYTWLGVPVGTYDLAARAVDNQGAISTSQPLRRVTVSATPPNQPPTVQITSPADGSTLDASANLAITANASDPDGSVNQVEFYVNGASIGTATSGTGGFSKPWLNATPGTYVLTAIATDNGGASTTSVAVTVRLAVHTEPGETIVFLHNDFAGNAVAATDATGAILWKESYRPFGDRMRREAASTANRQWFGGKAEDSDTGLSYFGARYYDPIAGRFASIDQKPFDGMDLHSFNRYSYANNNPYRYVDPDGRAVAAVIGVTAGALIIGGGFSQLSYDQRLAAIGALSKIGEYTLYGQLAAVANLILNEGKSSDAGAGSSKPLRDGENATPEQVANSVGGPDAGKPVSSGERQRFLDGARNADGTWTCWRCGATTDDPSRIHIGHRNVPRSKGGNKSEDNLACEGASCNQSAGNRGEVKPGGDCKSQGGC
jgi:RHS repeat-associated protein